MRVCHKYMTHPLSIIYPSFSDEDQSHVFIAYSIHIVGWRHLPLSLLFSIIPNTVWCPMVIIAFIFLIFKFLIPHWWFLVTDRENTVSSGFPLPNCSAEDGGQRGYTGPVRQEIWLPLHHHKQPGEWRIERYWDVQQARCKGMRLRTAQQWLWLTYARNLRNIGKTIIIIYSKQVVLMIIYE